MELFQGFSRWIKRDISLSMSLLKELQIHVSLPVTIRLLVFTATMVVRLLVFQRQNGGGKGGWE